MEISKHDSMQIVKYSLKNQMKKEKGFVVAISKDHF